MSLKHAILGFLSFVPLSGYDLKKAFDKSVSHFWPANQSQIYRTLAELEREGLVEKEVMKIYAISEAGHTELHRWLSTPLPPQDTREPFLIQVYFGGKLADEELIHLLQHEITGVQERLEVYKMGYALAQEQPSRVTDPRAIFMSLLTLEYGLTGQVVLLQWLQRALERIQTGNYTPATILELTGDEQ
jgi:DNA-binding PadR family transcriptional regulator